METITHYLVAAVFEETTILPKRIFNAQDREAAIRYAENFASQLEDDPFLTDIFENTLSNPNAVIVVEVVDNEVGERIYTAPIDVTSEIDENLDLN
mgnify:CR=1 FL=1